MHYNQSCAAKGEQGNWNRHQLNRSMHRAAVNIFKTATTYEMLVFAPGRLKEHFHLNLSGNQLKVSYTPPAGFPQVDWVRREYSRGGFERTFTLDTSFDSAGISAKYLDGVLQVSLPLVAGSAPVQQEIVVN